MLLTVFIDALKPESLEYMEFINTLEHKARVVPELGYSIACHASMYTGVHTNKHEYWFIWEYNPKTSPFRWISKLHIPDNMLTRLLSYQITRLVYRKKYRSYYSIHFLWDIPLKYWRFFDVSEKKFWTEQNYSKYKTIFEIFREYGINYIIIGMDKFPSIIKNVIKQILFQSQKRVKKSHNRKINCIGNDLQWVYLFYGEIDGLSHQYGQDHPIVVNRIKEIDIEIETITRELLKRCHEDVDILLFSDHGHHFVEKFVDIHKLFKKHGYNLNEFIHIIDANYARFWFRNEKERRIVEHILNELSDVGYILDDKLKYKYKVNTKTKNYGDLIFYLDLPCIFQKPSVKIGPMCIESVYKSMHGYLPDYEEMKGVIVTNLPIRMRECRIVDICPTLLDYFGIYSKHRFKYMDGRPIWRNPKRY